MVYVTFNVPLTWRRRNYTGDVLQFGLAKEQYAALHPDKTDHVKFIIVGDDVAVGKTQGTIVGRRYPILDCVLTVLSDVALWLRGLAGTCLVYKIAGALARNGGSLDEVYNIAEWVSSRIATIGVGSEHCHVRQIIDLVSCFILISHRFLVQEFTILTWDPPRLR